MKNAIVIVSLLCAAGVFVVSLCGPTTNNTPQESMSKDKVPTLMGREIINTCACGKEVHIYERQDMDIDPTTGKWQRICEECIVNRPKEKLTNGLALA